MYQAAFGPGGSPNELGRGQGALRTDSSLEQAHN